MQARVAYQTVLFSSTNRMKKPVSEGSGRWLLTDPEGELRFATGDHQTQSCDQQNNADGRSYLFIMLRCDADMSVTDADAVMLGVREGYEKRDDPQHRKQYANQQ
jgi:hypothetical protein